MSAYNNKTTLISVAISIVIGMVCYLGVGMLALLALVLSVDSTSLIVFQKRIIMLCIICGSIASFLITYFLRKKASPPFSPALLAINPILSAILPLVFVMLD